MVKLRYLLLTTVIISVAFALPANVAAQKKGPSSLSDLEKQDAKLRTQEKELLRKLNSTEIDQSEKGPAGLTIEPELEELSASTTTLANRADRLNARLNDANSKADDILARAQLAIKKINELQTSHSFMDDHNRSEATRDLPVAYIAAEQVQLLADPEESDAVLAKMLRGTPVYIEYLGQTAYRIVTNNGVRGWLPGSALVFKPDDFHSGSSLIQIKSIQPM